jgi:hypothetical protein
MKLSRATIMGTVVSAVWLAAGAASAQQYPAPVWTDVVNQLNSPTMASGNYYNAGSGQGPVFNTDLAGLRPSANTLTLPANVTSLPGPGGAIGCNSTSNFPVAYLESNLGGTGILNQGGIKGVGFLGSFNSPHPFNNTPPNNFTGNIFESVFFNENLCYGGNSGIAHGREYGFFLATWDNSIWAYWGTDENQGIPGTQGQFQLPGVSANTQYYFEMYPVIVGGSCVFQIAIYLPNFSIWYASAPDVSSFGGSSILANDPGFCAGIVSDTGYVSANIEPSSPFVSGSVPSLPDSRLNLSMQRVFVGK